jgi:hypothetical protein
MLSSFENHTAIRSLLKERPAGREAFITMNARTLDFLQSFQFAQDSRAPWGTALDEAHKNDVEQYGTES